VTVVDCASDTVLGNILVTTGLSIAYSDSISDKVYFADDIRGNLRVINAGTDSFYKSVVVGSVGAMVDNGRTGSAHRLYSAAFPAERVDVVDGTTDNILRRIQVGEDPSALAWNPAHSWVYVSNSAGSSITVLRDTLAVGIEENQPQASSNKLQATVVRGVLFLNGDCPRTGTVPKAALLDVSGRKVLDLHPGANDVGRLSPGVYFVREAHARVLRRVVVTR
jgi:DNA-binding beta-propeller fold protein YncE